MADSHFLNPKLPKLCHGGDDNPAQRPPEVRDEDVRLVPKASAPRLAESYGAHPRLLTRGIDPSREAARIASFEVPAFRAVAR